MAVLKKYRAKRDFTKTTEPRGGAESHGGEPVFVIQKHAARRLHYDFRLEHDGVLLSWAVPKGPSLDPRVRRLAVEVEPHPVEYATFEGTIPKGEYGGGTVLVWDRGYWEATEDPDEALKRGRLSFSLHGKKLNGTWHLVRSGTAGEQKNWFLIKGKDEHASADDGILEHSRSVLSGRDLDEIATGGAQVWRSRRSARASHDGGSEVEVVKRNMLARTEIPIDSGAVAAPVATRAARAPRHSGSASAQPPRRRSEGSRRAARLDPSNLEGVTPASLPDRVVAELATLVDAAPEGDEWIHELKFDGYRIFVRVEQGEVKLLTRSGKDWTERMPSLARVAPRLGVENAVLDGEFVALDEHGISDFQKLQNQLSLEQDESLVYCAFDLIHLNGSDLSACSLLERKRLLKDLVQGLDEVARRKIRFSEHVVGNGRAYFREACARSLEGIVSKRASSHYRAGRTKDWLKVKCLSRQEFVVVGFTSPGGTRRHLGALLLAVRSGRSYRFVGRVGTGFTERSLQVLHEKLAPIRVATPQLIDPPTGSEARDVTWVRPQLVAEVNFLGFTHEGLLRHASFLGLREDKEPSKVQLEKSEPELVAERAPPRRAEEARPENAAQRLGAAQVLTNPDKVMFPELGVTKRELLDYYSMVAEHMLPHVSERPLTLLRCPNGRDKPCFFQKHPGEGTPPAIRQVPIREKEGKAPYSVIDNPDGLRALVQVGVLEVHTWGSRVADVSRPDVLVFDLDPDPDLPFERVMECAKRVRELFASFQLESFVKTTGGKGLHVCVPIVPDLEWDDAKAFCRQVAAEIVKLAPDEYLATQSKAKRKGKIFIDYLRNARGATFVAPYSTRARPGAPIATPIEWEELTPELRPDRFNLKNIAQRLGKTKEEPFARMLRLRQRLRR